MCRRFTVTTEPEMLEERFHAALQEHIRPRYNAAPSQKLPVILNTKPDKIQLLQWGLKPKWLEHIPGRSELINVRAESFWEKRTFEQDLRHRRCLVLADGFYEWQKASGKWKIPYRIILKNEELFAFAGIWEDNRFAIITTKANEAVEPIHNRMPVIIPKHKERAWLTETNFMKILEFLKPYNPNLIESYLVSRKVNNAKLDTPEVVQLFQV